MTFEEWWKEMKPAECDELKEHFVDCWNTAVEECEALSREMYLYSGVDIAEAIRARSTK